MGLRVLGEDPLAKDENGKLRSRIGTLFPDTNTVVTLLGIHATQRLAYVDFLNQERLRNGLPILTKEEREACCDRSVDLIMEDDAILIRPDPENMPLAFEGDELLQQFVPKHKIRFLNVLNEKVRLAVKKRGECWRITALPKSPDEMKEMIAASRIGIHGDEIYYYNKTAGTRLLTCHEFSQLGSRGPEPLRRYLAEIKAFSGKFNRRGNPEIDFFMADGSFSNADLAGHNFRAFSPDQLIAVYRDLLHEFENAVGPEYRNDDRDCTEWRNGMCAALLGQPEEVISEETLLGLSPEFFMQIQWLPGGRIEEGELIFDPIFEQDFPDAEDRVVKRLYDEKSRGFIFNFVREYGDLEYINIGRVTNSLSRRPVSSGRRAVYIAEVKQKDSDKEIVSIIRMQKWGVQEHLDEGKELLDAILESEEYTEYVLDRRLGCRQLGMNIPARVTARRLLEEYDGKRADHHGLLVRTPYLERDYIAGIATDKIPKHRFGDDTFALRFARLLGRAAAPNIIVGRCNLKGEVLFDDGDEVVLENENGMPTEIIVSDQTGTFADYGRDLREVASQYAGPINRLAKRVSNLEEFAAVYVRAFVERFSAIKKEYRNRKRAFDTLFKHHQRDEKGSFAYRWEAVLRRLSKTDPRELAALIQEEVK